MNRFATLLALILVVWAVSAGISTSSGTSLVLATVLLATGVFVHRFVASAVTANSGVRMSTFREFTVCVIQNVFRFAIGAIAIAWMAIGALWFFGA